MSQNTIHASILETVCELARQAGHLTRERLGHARSSRKQDRTIVTDADVDAQSLIIRGVASRFGDHAVFGEEAQTERHGLPVPADAEYCWVIDPLDGTRNFARGFPCFCTSIGVLQQGVPVVGAVYDPMLDHMFHAAAGRGAFLNGNRLRARDEAPHTDTMVGVPSGHNKPMPKAVHQWIDRINLRNMGATALHQAYVAAGWWDGAYAHECRVWDIAAGWLLVREAGAVITAPDGSEIFPADLSALGTRQTPYLAAGPKLHAELLASLGTE